MKGKLAEATYTFRVQVLTPGADPEISLQNGQNQQLWNMGLRMVSVLQKTFCLYFSYEMFQSCQWKGGPGPGLPTP